MGDKVADILYYDFHKLLRDPKVKEEVCMRMHDTYHRTFKPKEVLKMEELM